MEETGARTPKSMRRKLFMLYHEDGIIDLVVGISMLMLATVMAFELNAFIGLIGIPIVVYIPIKQQLSIPRVGHIRFEAEDVVRKRLSLIALFGLGFLMLVLFFVLRGSVSAGAADMLGNNLVPIFAVLLGGTLFTVGWIMNNRRFAAYGILGLVFVMAAYFLSIPVWVSVTVLGILVEGLAISKLVNFMHAYPMTREALENGE